MVCEIYSNLDPIDKIFDFWLFLARLALNKQVIEKCVFAEDKKYSSEDFSIWLTNCFRIKQNLLAYPYEVAQIDANLIFDLELLKDSEDMTELYKDIFYLYRKRPYYEWAEDDDLYDRTYEDEESSPE